MIPAKSICKTGPKECVVQTSGCKKKHVTIVLLATADGKRLPSMIIFKGKTDGKIQKLHVPEGLAIKTKKKAWMDNWLMHVWVENIWLKQTKAMPEKLDFENSLLSAQDRWNMGKANREKDRYFDDSAWLHFKMPVDGYLY